MIDAIVLSNKRLDTIADWQKAIDATGFSFVLETPIPMESLDGRVSAKWRRSSDLRGRKFEFQARHLSTAVGTHDFDLPPVDVNYSAMFAIGWTEDTTARITALVSAAAYAKATAGVIVRNGGICSANDILDELSQADKYQSLPRGDTTLSTPEPDISIYRYDERPKTTIKNTGSINVRDLKDAKYAVLVGRNNSGKSFALKALTWHWGNVASYLGPGRYQNFNLLTHYTPTEDKQDQKWKQFSSHWANETQNVDNSPWNLQQAIAELTNDQRARLQEIVELLLNVRLEFKYTVENSDMSQKYVSCNNHNISFTSSGVRLITTLVTSLLDDSYEVVLIDEPELGISPEAQGILADFLSDQDKRRKYFPHIKTLFLATHSTIFVDRQNIRSNYVVEKNEDTITINRIENQREFNRLHFWLLGNRFETLYLPSLIVLVEGKSDHKFIDRVLSLKYPHSRFSIIAANSDSQIKHYLHMAKGLLNDIQRSPYHDRIFVLLDSVHSAGLAAEVVAMGIPGENVIKWSKNGIEYFYPEEVVDQIFGKGPELQIMEDVVSRNGISMSKAELADRVSAMLHAETKMNPEFQRELLDKINMTLI